LPALVLTIALSRIAFAAAFPHPGWEQAEKDLLAHWQDLRPNEGIVALKHTDQQHFRSNGHWYEIGYPFDLTLKQPSGTRNVKAEVNYVNKLSSPYVFAGIGIDGPGEDTDQAADKANPSQVRARDIIMEYLGDREPVEQSTTRRVVTWRQPVCVPTKKRVLEDPSDHAHQPGLVRKRLTCLCRRLEGDGSEPHCLVARWKRLVGALTGERRPRRGALR